MAKLGNIFLTEKNFTDTEVQQEFCFPCILILHDNNTVIQKITAYDKTGTKTIYDFSLAASKDFVTQSIADAIAGLQDNTLEFPTFADFPQPGEVGNIYIDLELDEVYIWDSSAGEYVSQSWDKTIINSINAQITALQSNKLDKPSLSINTIPFWHVSGNFFNTVMSYLNGKFGINISGEASEKLEVGGRVKSDGQVFNETTSAILPREIKFKAGNFVAAGNDGVEKKILREGEAVVLPLTWTFGKNSATGNTGVGANVFNSLTSGINNGAFGNGTLRSLTTGSANIAIGGDATMTNTTTGSANVAIGADALNNNTTGSSNISIGANSMNGNSTGNDNVVIGRYASGGNTNSKVIIGSFASGSGAGAVIIGAGAGGSNSGSSQIAIGSGSGNGVTGVHNISLGINSGRTGSGNYNLSMGVDSLNGAGNSNENVTIGIASCFVEGRGTTGITSSNYNVAVGMRSGSTSNLGDYNTLIGHYTGNSEGSTTPFHKRILIGARVCKVDTTIDGYPISINMEASVPYGKHNYKNLPLRFQLPNLTKSQRDALVSKTVGEMIWQTDSGNSGIRVYDGTNWLALQTTID